MYKTAKALHFLGLAMARGSILGHVGIGLVPCANDQRSLKRSADGGACLVPSTWFWPLPASSSPR
jgi:hypothetical protein